MRLVDIGNIVTDWRHWNTPGSGGGAVLLTIQGLDPIYTDFTVAETDLALVRRYLGGPNVKVQTDFSDGINSADVWAIFISSILRFSPAREQ